MTFDFHTTFPPPTEEALRELVCGIHYPDPEDEEAQYWHWHETCAWYVALLASRKAAMECAAVIRRTGRRPDGKGKLREPEKHAKLCERDARHELRQANDILFEIFNVYGRPAAIAFRRHCLDHTDDIQAFEHVADGQPQLTAGDLEPHQQQLTLF